MQEFSDNELPCLTARQLDIDASVHRIQNILAKFKASPTLSVEYSSQVACNPELEEFCQSLSINNLDLLDTAITSFFENSPSSSDSAESSLEVAKLKTDIKRLDRIIEKREKLLDNSFEIQSKIEHPLKKKKCSIPKTLDEPEDYLPMKINLLDPEDEYNLDILDLKIAKLKKQREDQSEIITPNNQILNDTYVQENFEIDDKSDSSNEDNFENNVEEKYTEVEVNIFDIMKNYNIQLDINDDNENLTDDIHGSFDENGDRCDTDKLNIHIINNMIDTLIFDIQEQVDRAEKVISN